MSSWTRPLRGFLGKGSPFNFSYFRYTLLILFFFCSTKEQDLYTESTAEPTISPDENTTESTFVTGFTDLPEDYTALPTEIYTELPENYTDLTESYYTDTPENYTELVTLEPEYVTEMVNETDSGENGTIGEQETCATSVKPRRYDIEDLGSDCLFRGWADVQAQGAANDYCR